MEEQKTIEKINETKSSLERHPKLSSSYLVWPRIREMIQTNQKWHCKSKKKKKVRILWTILYQQTR